MHLHVAQEGTQVPFAMDNKHYPEALSHVTPLDWEHQTMKSL